MKRLFMSLPIIIVLSLLLIMLVYKNRIDDVFSNENISNSYSNIGNNVIHRRLQFDQMFEFPGLTGSTKNLID